MIPDSLLTALSTMAKSFGRNFKTLGDKIDALADKIADKNAQNNRLIADAINALKASVSNPTVKVELDTSSFTAELSTISQTIAANKPEKTDLSAVTAGLGALVTKLDDQTKQFGELFSSVTSGLENVNNSVKLIKPKDTFKLDDMQMRALATAGSGGTPGGTLAPRSMRITTVTMASANTEYTHTLSANCTGYFIKLRAQNVLLLLATSTGTLPTSGDGSAYLTVPQNGMLSPMGLDVGGRTLYLQTGSASQVAEIQEFIA